MKQPGPVSTAVGRFLGAVARAALMLAVARGGAPSRGGPSVPNAFPVPEPGHVFHYPADHGGHPEFRIEWWYVTGHLQSADNRRFGFQATFFRAAAPHDETGSPGSGAFGTGQLFLAHMALLDAASGRFLHEERLNREGWDASAAVGRLAVTNGPWALRAAGAGDSMHLDGGIRNDAAFELDLSPLTPVVVFGKDGISRKGAGGSAASYYLSFPRISVSGLVRLGAQAIPVRGQAWMDHEISSSQLGPHQVGWDWTCLQLADGTELMCYRMRRDDGARDPFSTLAWVDRGGRVSYDGPDQFTWEVLETWTSPATHARYPVRVRLTARQPSTGEKRTFILAPLARAQEIDDTLGGNPYWEGACRVLDPEGAEVGAAFLELTGYAGRLRL